MKVNTSLGLHRETHRSCEEVLRAHSQHRAEVLGGRDGLPHQGEVDPQDDRAYHILHTVLREDGLLRTHSLLPSFPRRGAGA